MNDMYFGEPSPINLVHKYLTEKCFINEATNISSIHKDFYTLYTKNNEDYEYFWYDSDLSYSNIIEEILIELSIIGVLEFNDTKIITLIIPYNDN